MKKVIVCTQSGRGRENKTKEVKVHHSKNLLINLFHKFFLDEERNILSFFREAEGTRV